MSDKSDIGVSANAQAAAELEGLHAAIREARSTLNRLSLDLAAARQALGSTPIEKMVRANEQVVLANVQIAQADEQIAQANVQLVLANERLVLTALRAQVEAEVVAKAMNVVTRTAELDVLTQLPNRGLVLDRLTQAIAHAQRHGTQLALLFLDLDNFKQINDTLGHDVGDEVLKMVAGRLASATRAVDTVGRHGGDEFLILLTEVAGSADASLIADKVLAAVNAPGVVANHALRLTASVGIGIYPEDGKDSRSLIISADAAMFHAKRRGLGHSTYATHAAWQRETGQLHSDPAKRSLTDPPLAQAGHDMRRVLPCEANESLLLAAMEAQQRQAAAEQALRRHAAFIESVAADLINPLGPLRLEVTPPDPAANDDDGLPPG